MTDLKGFADSAKAYISTDGVKEILHLVSL